MHDTGWTPAVPGLCAADVVALMRAASGGAGVAALAPPKVLQGRHVAVLAPGDHHPSAAVFAGAAQALGAHVSRIALADLAPGDPASAADTARMLGRLYTVIGCAGLDLKSVTLLRRCSGVPVLHDLAADTHATRLLADLMTLKQVLQDAPPNGSTRPRLGVCAAPGSSLWRAWRKMAAGAGFDVVELGEACAHGQTAGCHFICRPGAPPELFAMGRAAAPTPPQAVSLCERQRSNHRLVVQALLCNALSARR